MPRKLIIVFILGAIIAVVSVDLRAQTEESAGGPAAEPLAEPETTELELLFDPNEGSGELRGIKEKIQSMLRENAELAGQAQALKQESLQLEEKLQASRALAPAPAKPAQTTQSAPQPGPPLARSPDFGGLDELAEGGRPQSLQQLRLYDLQYQQKELELELKLKELASRGKQQVFDRQLEGSRKELEQNAAEEKRLAEEARVLKDSAALGYELEFLKQENILLEDQLKLPGTPRGSGDLPERAGPAWENIRRKEEEKTQLEHRLKQLEQEQERSSADPKLSSFEKEFRKSVQRLEQENQQLDDQIFSLREKIQKRSQ